MAFNYKIAFYVLLCAVIPALIIICCAACVNACSDDEDEGQKNDGHVRLPKKQGDPSKSHEVQIPVITGQPKKDLSPTPMGKFLLEMERENPTKFTSGELRHGTNNFAHLLGTGGFGRVYKGSLGGVPVAVKVLNGVSDKRIEEQFMAEVSTIGRTRHLNLVRLLGFCYEDDLRALVYEYMSRGSLDQLLVGGGAPIEWRRLQGIAVGTAKGMAYLHEDCKERIIHYDIKPGNVLVDEGYCAKVADFGVAKLFSREKTHLTMSQGRGTPGYAAPELWMSLPATSKCDVYSFGMLLFEVWGRRRNYDESLPEEEKWLPKWVWGRVARGELGWAVAERAGVVEEEDRRAAERMALVALWCVQHRPTARPQMSDVVRMLEGVVEVPTPPNPFSNAFPVY